MQPNPTPREYTDKDKRCHYCDTALEMYEWGDFGWCPKCKFTWNMFLGKPGPKKDLRRGVRLQGGK